MKRSYRIPLIKRRDGKRILLEFALAYVYRYGEPATAVDITEDDLNGVGLRVLPFRCKKCFDTGQVGAGPGAPLTGIECSAKGCKAAAQQEAASQDVWGLRARVQQLEKLLADRALAAPSATD